MPDAIIMNKIIYIFQQELPPLIIILPLFYMGRFAEKLVKDQLIENLFSKLCESCSEPLMRQTVDQKLFLPHLYFSNMSCCPFMLIFT